MSNDIVSGTGAKITKDTGYQPCTEHGGTHQVRTVVGTKGKVTAQVTQTKGGQTEAHVSKPVTNSRGETQYIKQDSHHGNDSSAAKWLREKLSDE